MKIAIYGAGAVGGYLGVHLSLAGEDVTLIARGDHLSAVQQSDLRLLIAGEERICRPRSVEDPVDAGPQDYVLLTTKAHQIGGVVEGIGPLLDSETVVVTMQNGIPWWYFYQEESRWNGKRLDSVDPGGKAWEMIGPERVIGGVFYPAVELVAPGVVRHLEGDRCSLGEPDGSKSARTALLAQTLIGSGLKAPIRTRIRNELWVKLWGNVAFNPISAITRAPLDAICRDPGTRALARAVMLEAEMVASALGETFRIDVDQRIEGAARITGHRTSMLQDLEKGRRLEVDAIVGAVSELGRLVGVPTPRIDDLYVLVCQLQEQATG